MSADINTRSWILKVVAMLLALAGVIWVMSSLKSPDAESTNSMGAFFGVPPTTTVPKKLEDTTPLEDKVIPARVKKGN